MGGLALQLSTVLQFSNTLICTTSVLAPPSYRSLPSSPMVEDWPRLFWWLRWLGGWRRHETDLWIWLLGSVIVIALMLCLWLHCPFFFPRTIYCSWRIDYRSPVFDSILTGPIVVFMHSTVILILVSNMLSLGLGGYSLAFQDTPHLGPTLVQPSGASLLTSLSLN